MGLDIGSTRAFKKYIAWDRSHPGESPTGESPIVKNMHFCPGTDISHGDHDRALSNTWVSQLLVAISLGSPNRGGAMFFGQFVFDVASVICVTYNCPLMRDRAIHQWILCIAPTRGRRCRRPLTCDKLRRSSEW